MISLFMLIMRIFMIVCHYFYSFLAAAPAKCETTSVRIFAIDHYLTK